MYYMPVDMCKLIANVVAYPWECLTKYNPNRMCDDLRKMLDDAGPNLFFDVISHPVIVNDGLVYRTFITVMSKDPELVLGVVSRAVLRDMVFTLYFTDAYGDQYSLNSVSFRTVGTEGLSMDTMDLVI